MAKNVPERTGYLTEQEVAAIQTLHRKAPYSIAGISQGMFSLARHGGMAFQECRYVYVVEFDECVREDVHKRVETMRRKAARAAKALETAEGKRRQGDLGM